MKHQFNKSALAKLSKSELFLLKANLKAQFQVAASKPEHDAIQSNIHLIDLALALK